MRKTGLRSRILAMILCFLMIFTSIPTDAFAAEVGTTTENVLEEKNTQETNEFSVPEIVEDETIEENENKENDGTEFDDLQINEIIEETEDDYELSDPTDEEDLMLLDLPATVSIKASFVAQWDGKFATEPLLDMDVSSDTAENYGFTDQTDSETVVSAVDVLVAAHVAVYGDEFTKENAKNYLVINANFVTTIFERDISGNLCVLVNGKMPGNDGIEQATMKDGDILELFEYQVISGDWQQGTQYTDKYLWLETKEGQKLDGSSLNGGVATELVVKGYAPFYASYDNELGKTATVSGADIYMVNMEDGSLTSLNATSGEGGAVTVTIPKDKIGETIYLTAKGKEMAMSLNKVTVTAPPATTGTTLSGLEVAVGGSTQDNAVSLTLSPAFAGETKSYTTPILDYQASNANRYVWVKVSAEDGATVTAKCASSETVTLTSGEWARVAVKTMSWGNANYSGCLETGKYNTLNITVTADGQTETYTVTIPMQPDISKAKLSWKTNLPEQAYCNPSDQGKVLSVEAQYENRPLDDKNEITYQWYKSTDKTTDNGTILEGQTGESYTAPSDNEGVAYYYVVATCGEKTLKSQVIEVHVTQDAAPTSITLVCDYDHTIQDTWVKALGGVDYVAKIGDKLTLRALDQDGKETPVQWPTNLTTGTLSATTGSKVEYTISNTSYAYFTVSSLFDSTIKSEEKALVVKDYRISTYYKTPSVTLATDGQSNPSISTNGGLSGYALWNYKMSSENIAKLTTDLSKKSNSLSFQALRPGTITASLDLDLDGDGTGDGLTDTATLTINGIAVEDADGNLGKTYLETSAGNTSPTVQLKALSSTENATFTWSSADETVATVDETGLVTAKGVGSVIISAKDSTYTGGIKVVVTSADVPYFETLDFTTTTAYGTGLSNASWKTANFKPTTQSYTGLKMTKAAADTLTFSASTMYDTEKWVATATYTDADGTAQNVTIASGATTALKNLPLETSTITVTLAAKADESVKTVYKFEVTRPRDTTKTIANGGIVFAPEGRDLWKDKYAEKTEGVMYVADANGNFTNGQNVSYVRPYYRVYAMNNLESFTLTIKGNTTFTHLRYSVDDGENWIYLGQTGTEGKKTEPITFPKRTEDDTNPVIKVTVQILDDATYTTNVKAGKDGFADTTPTSHYVWVEQIGVISAECDILTAETSYGDWYPAFKPEQTTYRLVTDFDAELPKLTYTVSKDAKVYLGETLQTPDEDGKYTLQLTEDNQSIVVKASNGMTEKTYSFGAKAKLSSLYPDKVVDYLSINSQYTNGSNGGYGIGPQQTLTGGLLSLGNFGGYVTFYYEDGLTDDPSHPYGVDFYVDGNAFVDTSTGTGLGSMEPGQVWVSEDGNTWYALAGSEHYEDRVLWNYSVTYSKTETGGTTWVDNQGNTSASTHGRAFQWPDASIYTMNDLASKDSITLSGVLIPCVDGTIAGTDNFNSFSSGGRFGYVDMLVNGTNNPYADNSDYKNASSGFDLAWAVDGNGDPVDVSNKSFHYVKVVTASNLVAGLANEKSTEVASVTRVASTETAVGVTTAPTGVTFTSGDNSYVLNFEDGKQVYEVELPGMDTVSVQLNGTSEDDNIYINNQRVTSGNAATGFAISDSDQRLIRIIVQNAEKEPVIYLLKVKSKEQVVKLSNLVFRQGTQTSKAEYTLSPAFDPDVREYTMVVPDSLSATAVWATLDDGTSGEITANYTSLNNQQDKSVKVTSGKATGTSLAYLVIAKDLRSNKLTICIDGTVAYTIKILRSPTLTNLSLTAGEETIALDKTFSATQKEYSALVAHDAELTINAAASVSGVTITINGKNDTVFKPVWNGRTSDITIKLSAEGAAEAEYILHLNQSPTKLEVVTPPTKTQYKMGETADITDIQVKATYADGGTEQVGADKLTVTPTGLLTKNNTTITLCYKGTKVEYPITVSSDLMGSGTQEDPWLLKTAADLETLRELVATGMSFEGEYLKMTANITLPANWAGIGCLIDASKGHIDKGNNLAAFSGTLDGGGYTVTVPDGGLPLFAYVRGATVKNLNIYGKKIAGYGLVNHLEGVGLSGNAITIDHVTLKAGSATEKAGFIGTYITNNIYGGCSKEFVVTIKNSKIEENVVVGYNADQKMIGSFAGRINGTIENCVSYATVKGTDYVGGILGTRDNAMGTCAVNNCQFYGTVEASGEHVGGIVGGGYENSTAPNGYIPDIIGCTVKATITGKDKVGGILGGDSFVAQSWYTWTMTGNTFSGTVKATSGIYVGGIVGYLLSMNKFTGISDNSYASDCGANRGIGYVKYLDTSAENATAFEGSIVMDTSQGTANCPAVTGCAWKADHNRTDDPLGKDADDLCKKVSGETPTEPTCYEIKASGTYKTEYTVGEELDLTGIVITAYWTGNKPETTLSLSDVEITGFDKNTAGKQTVTLSYGSVKTEIPITVKNKEGMISVTLSIMGDQAHDSDSDGKVHTLTDGNLTTWVAAKAYTISSNTTAWELIKSVLDENQMTYSNPTGNYIEWITKDGVKLDQKANGKNSGWMFTVNGVHGLLGVSEQYMKTGDVLVLHYTDDYTKEKDDVEAMTAEEVIALIEQIPSTITLDCKDKIEAARAAYTKLEASEQSNVTNYQKLLDAEKALKALQQSNANIDIENVYLKTGNYLGSLGTPNVGSIGGEWMVVGLARSGKTVPAGYFDNVASYVKKNIDSNGRLHTTKSTDNSRLILALTAAGYDPRNVGGYNLVTALSDMDYVEKQGINGPIWALIALNSHSYATLAMGPDNPTTRTGLVKKILSAQLSDGGWALSGTEADSDMTGMALQALAPYYDSNATVKAAVDKALTKLSAMQEDNGAFATVGTITSESTAQVIVALSALGIDADTDSRFIKNGFSAMDALLSFAVDGGGFAHLAGGSRDGMATEQGYYALTAYMRMKDGKTSLYDMSDVMLKIGTVTDQNNNNNNDNKDNTNKNDGNDNVDQDKLDQTLSEAYQKLHQYYLQQMANQQKMYANLLKNSKNSKTASTKKTTAAAKKTVAAKISETDLTATLEEVREKINKATEASLAGELLDVILSYEMLTEEDQKALGMTYTLESMKKQLAAQIQTDDASGIVLSGADWNIELVVADIMDLQEVQSLSEKLNGYDALCLWDISLKDLLTGEAYTPGESVLIKIPLESIGDYSSYDGLVVVHYTQDGGTEFLNCTIVGNYLVFNTVEFSNYAVVGYHGASPAENLMNPTFTTEDAGANRFAWVPWTICSGCGLAVLGALYVTAVKNKKKVQAGE